MICPACRSDVAPEHRFCPTCGAARLATASQVTQTSPVQGSAPLTMAAEVRDAAGFTPGTILVGRYRIVSLIGKGGMGEVYRADDLKLGMPVALKFLPRALRHDLPTRERLIGEVRVARQVTHPNVCRVFDFVEGGAAIPPFLTMEYVDGEDLASLLRRIGRLPSPKALDIAHQLCAGLAAAHARGVLHRDLKPANVLLDGRGRVRITDFGIAIAADVPARRGEIAGTPAYMAPEQLAGGAATVGSDIYALGLVLYELFAGLPAFGTRTDRAAAERDIPRGPSTLHADVDPAIDRVIIATLAASPTHRPRSVLQVAAALPGGNLVEAALRAGETPTPEMIAASGARVRVPAHVAAWLLTIIIAATAVALHLGQRGLLWRTAAPEQSPDVLAAEAREMLAAFAPSSPSFDTASGFEVDLNHLRFLQARQASWRSTNVDPSPLRFWYRQSPQPLEAWRSSLQYGNVSRVTPSDPPLVLAGMSLVRLDSRGRLTQLLVVPAPPAFEAEAGRAVDWHAVLTRAGFDAAAWRSAAPQRMPPVYAEERAAWEGVWPGDRAVPTRIEAAALRGQLVFFEAIFPWTPAPLSASSVLAPGERTAVVLALLVLIAVIVATAIVARRHVRAGRGDRRGAVIVSTFVFIAMVVSWLFGERHAATLWEAALVTTALATALLAAALCWMAYLAVEPFLRRFWPEVLVSWTRLLGGEWRDPLIGRDVLVGCATGTSLASVAIVALLLPEWRGFGSSPVFADVYGVVYSVRTVIPLLVWRGAQAVAVVLAAIFLLLIARMAFRSSAWAVALLVSVYALISSVGVGQGHFWVTFAGSAIHGAVFLYTLTRYGLVAGLVQFYVWGLFVFFPMTTDLDAWYAGAGVTALLVLAALSAYGAIAATSERVG